MCCMTHEYLLSSTGHVFVDYIIYPVVLSGIAQHILDDIFVL